MITDTLKAVGLWFLLFSTAISLMFLPLITPWLSSFLFAVLFPIMVFFISSFPRFHIKPEFVMGAAIATLLFSTGIGMIKSVKEARKDPEKHVAAAAGYYAGVAGFFVLVIFLASFVKDLHKYKNIPMASFA